MKNIVTLAALAALAFTGLSTAQAAVHAPSPKPVIVQAALAAAACGAACAQNSACCADAACGAMPDCCEGACCDPVSAACTSACGCARMSCCAP